MEDLFTAKADKPKEEEKAPTIDKKKLDEIKGKINLDTKFLIEDKDDKDNQIATDLRKAQEKDEK